MSTCQVPESDFGRTVKSPSSDTLYEATNREKLNRERGRQIPQSGQEIPKRCSDIAGRTGLGLSNRDRRPAILSELKG
jgi:hypothetical protein